MREQPEWKILLVDDDEDDYHLTRTMLSNFNYRTADLKWVPNFHAGIHALEQDHYDAVLIDYDLGSHTGIELISRVASNYPAPLILFTGRGSYETDIEAMQAGATLYISKAEANPLLLERLIRYAIQLKKAETALRQARDEAEQRAAEAEEGRCILHSLMTCIPQGIAIADSLTGKVRLMSSYGQAQMRQLSGKIEGEAPETDWESWPVDFAQDGVHLLPHQFPLTRAAVLGEEIKNEKLVLKGVNGHQIPILCNAGPVVDNAGKVTGGVIAWQDITEQEKLQAEFRQQSELLEKLVQEAPAGIAFLEGPEHRLKMVNKIMRQMLPGKGEVIGCTVAEVWPEISEQILPLLDEVYTTGKPFSAVDMPFEIRREHDIETRYSTFTFVPIRSVQGRIEGVMVLGTETTEQMRSRIALENNHALFTAVLRQMPSGVMIGESPTGKLLLSNHQAQKIWQFDDLSASSISDYRDFKGFHSDGRPYQADEWPMTRTLHTGEVVENEEITIQRGDNTTGVISVSSSPVNDSKGRRIAGVMVFLDITKQKRAELALQESEARITSFLENLQDGFFALDTQWNFTYLNQIAAAVGDHSPQELVGRNIWELYPQLTGTELEKRYRQVMETHIPTRFQYPGLHSNIWFEIGVNPTVDGISVYWVDISQRKQMEDRLAYLALVLDNVHDAILATDADQMITAWNQAAEDLYGWKEHEAIGKIGGQLLRSELSDEQRAEVKRQIEESHRCSLEVAQYTKDGRRLIIEGKVIAIRDAAGNITGYVTSNRDVSDRKLAVQALQYYSKELEQSNRELEEFAATASHDLQEPLRKIDAFSSLLETEISSGGENVSMYVERLKDASARMQKMIDGLLALSHVRAKGHAFQTVDLNEVALEVIENLEIRINQSGGKVIISDLPLIEADPVQMIQLLQNLVANALKFNRPGIPPVVKVESKQADLHWVEIHVIDNGIGFDMKYQAQAFQPFYRLHPKSEYDGSGMGLPICRKIVERHAGTINVQTSPGEGSTFIVKLPRFPIAPI